MRNFYIADTHFGHKNCVNLDNRPFATLEEMEATMIMRWNTAVNNPTDTIYILGDFCWGKEEQWKSFLQQLNGNKVLIKGNHDLENMSRSLKNMFQDIKDFKEIGDKNYHVIMSHYPQLLYKASYNPNCYMLCGHVHLTRENDFLEKWTKELKESRTEKNHNCGNIINVGCMMPWMDYTPRTLSDIITRKAAYEKNSNCI